jgi:hypothetical protein
LPGALTETVALATAGVPVPLQVSVNVVLADNVPVDCVPEVALPPVQPPEAVHEVAFVEDQVSIELAPAVTEVGLALSVAVGAGVEDVTSIVTAAYAVVPLAAVHVRENKVSAARVPVLPDPLAAFMPLQPPEAVQFAASEVQLNIELPPAFTLIGLAVIETVGGVSSGGASLLLDSASAPQADKSSNGATSAATPKTRRNVIERIRFFPQDVRKQAHTT